MSRRRMHLATFAAITVAAVSLLAGASSAAAEPAIAQATPTGKIAFTSTRDGNSEIYVMNADGSAQSNLTNHPAFDDDPAWSRDGEKLAFQRNGEIYVMNADGTGQTRLTDNTAQDSNPSWSPDGQRIAFHSNRDGNVEIYVMNADGSDQTRLTDNPGVDSAPSWSPDGQKLAFRGGGPPAGIYVMNVDGSGQTPLSPNTADFGYSTPEWSPDGQKIAVTRVSFASPQNWDISVMNADGSGHTRLTNDPAFDGQPTWSPDGQHLAYRSERDGNSEIYVMNAADGSDQTRVTNNPAVEQSPAWQPQQESVSFEWTVPDRFGGDADEGGVIDYFEPDGFLEIHPDGFRVDFTTDTPLDCDTTLSRTWSIDGQEVAADDPRIVFYDPNDCRFSYRFEDEGTYQVELEVERADGSLLGFKTHEVVVQDFLIVSLGDSVASGEGNPDLPQASGLPERWQDQQCHRTALAGPAQAAIQLEQADSKTSVTFVHLACSGATIDEGLLGRHAGIERGRMLPPQVDEMRDLVGEREIDAVLVSIGANDVQFVSLITRCVAGPDCHLEYPASAASHFERLIVRLPGRYDRLDSALDAQVPSQRVYISEYFDPTRNGTGGFCDNILADHPDAGGPFQITAEEAQWASENMLVRLNAEVFGAAVRHDWRYAGGIRSPFLTHGYCAAPLNWVLTYTESMLVQGDQNGTIHPNVPGHRLYGDRIVATLRADLYEGGDLDSPRPPE